MRETAATWGAFVVAAGWIILIGLIVTGCTPDTPTPVPTETPMPTDTPVPTDTAVPTETPEPTPTELVGCLESGECTRDELAQSLIDDFGTVNGVDLEPTGDYQWIDGDSVFIYIGRSALMGDWPGLEMSEQDVEEWAAPMIARMFFSFGGYGEDWMVFYTHRRVEPSGELAGKIEVMFGDLADWDWVDVSEDYDTEAGGFHVTEHPIIIGDLDDRVHVDFVPYQIKHNVDYYSRYLD